MKFDAEIVVDPTFESAVIKLQYNRHGELTAAEQDVIEDLKGNSEAHDVEEGEAILTIAERALRKRRLDKSCSGKYFDLCFILPTSNIVERLFSTVGFALNYRRRVLLPSNLEMHFFLKLNKELWGISDVNSNANINRTNEE